MAARGSRTMAAGAKKDWLDALSFPLLFTWVFGAYLLFFKAPAVNGKQQAFRVALFGVGLVGSLLVFGLKAARSRRRGP